MLLHGFHALHCGINVYEKNYLTSIFKWLVTWKQSQYQNFHSKIYFYDLLYHIPLPKSQKEFFAKQKSLRVLKHGRVIDRVLFRFYSDRVLFLSDGVLLRVLSDRVLFESSVIGSSSGFSVIDSSLGPSVLFFWHAANFYQYVLLLFLLKKMFCFTLYFREEVHI